MNTLCLDCGNTRLKWGVLSAEGAWLARGALAHAAIGQLRQALDTAGIGRIAQAVGCNVADPAFESILAEQVDIAISWTTPARAQCGVTNGYVDIAQLGLDRWVGLIGARSLHGGNCVVVNAGTATTIDALTADGHFLGGLILPGLDLMRQSLAQNTARLPLAEAPYAALPTGTAAAIVSGAVEATLGAIERMHARLQRIDPEAVAPTCVLTGGAASQLAPLLHIQVKSVDDLTLQGLACIARTLSPALKPSFQV